MLPPIETYAKMMVRQCELSRLAGLAIEIRRYERLNERWPTSLAELAASGIDLEQLRPATDGPFGYRVEANGDAVVWGIPNSGESPIPPEPPPIDWEMNEDNIGWVWRLHSKKSPDEN